jgi:hypothetical protein
MTEIACALAAGDALGASRLWRPATRQDSWLDILKP